jgi:hypothetical protein
VVGQGSACHDRGGLALSERSIRGPAGGDLLDDLETRRARYEVGRADSVAVHEGLVEGRQVQVGGDVFGEGETECVPEGKGRGRQRGNRFEDGEDGLLDGQHWSVSCSSVADRLPLVRFFIAR